jgi:hypothetical protein
MLTQAGRLALMRLGIDCKGLRRLLALAIVAVWQTTSSGSAQQSTTSYPSSQTITPSSLSPDKRLDLETLVNTPLPPKEVSKVVARLCPHAITRSLPRNDALRGAITETKVQVATELLFEKVDSSKQALIGSFSLVVEFSPSRALIRHTRPRFPSELAGYSAPLSNETTRAVRLEGEMGADLFLLIPPVRECGVQALAVCTRSYEKVARLIPAPYELKKFRLLVNAKSDAVVAASNEAPLKAMVSILGSPWASLPTEWFESSVGAKTISVTKSVSHDLSAKASQPGFMPLGTMPQTISVESRIDIGSEAEALLTSRKRTTIELSGITISDKPQLLVGRSPLSIDGGQCYLLTQWSEEWV